MPSIQTIETRDQLDALLRSSIRLVVVDVYAEWCGPCKVLAPQLEQLAATLNHQSVVICKVNLEHVPMENINSVPTIQFWELQQGGQRILTKTVVGADIKAIQAHIDTILSGTSSSSSFSPAEHASRSNNYKARGRVYATFGSLQP